MKRKFKMRKLFQFKRKKLGATAMRRLIRIGATTTDYGELAEPSMKLSRALLIVLLLHVVAVAGIIAFNAIKIRQGPTISSTAPATSPAKSDRTAPAPSAQGVKRAVPLTNPTDTSYRTYVVAKGDNPVTIAKKFKVPYDDLLAFNHIDDPRKLKIGQKLLIPEKTKTAKKSE